MRNKKDKVGRRKGAGDRWMDPPSQIEPRGEEGDKGVAIAISSHLLILPSLLSYDSTVSSLRLVSYLRSFLHSLHSLCAIARARLLHACSFKKFEFLGNE